ncbi:MAG: hypothetical protein JSW65_08500, partial [Candidatus Bipolaricaulota bacterium]
ICRREGAVSRDRRWVLGAAGVAAVVAACLLALPAERCGDGTRDGPENAANCPQDCGTTDLLPNPLRAIVSEELLAWRNWLTDGGFESGDDIVELLPHPAAGLSPAAAARAEDAARTGSYGMRIEAGSDQGIIFAVRAKIEKGERTRFTVWLRSHGERAEPKIVVLGVERGRAEPRTLHTPQALPPIAQAWTEIQFEFANTRGVDYALLTIEVDPGTVLDLDDVAVESEQWGEPSTCRLERTVGGIRVPLRPAAPVHFCVLIHIEDPAMLTQRVGYFLERTAVFSEIARTLHEHGGFLTIQPEEDWAMAALRFAPETLSSLAQEYGVVYSTHTHGPACRDDRGRLRSSQDCSGCRGCAGWEPVESDSHPATREYVGALRDLLSEVSGTNVSDHNGNFEYRLPSHLADVGIATWSAFKDHNTQATFDRLFTNPWRPTACNAIETPELFQTHDPATRVIYIPGWGQAITRHPERIHERLAGMLGQVLCHADPDRVNAFYIVTHVDHYRSEAGAPYIEVNEETGDVTLHEEFLRDLAFWEKTLTELIDPLVEEGYLQWTSLPEIGRLFMEWETSP